MIIIVEECPEFIDIIKKDVNVRDAVVAELSDVVVVAVLSDGIFTRSDGLSLKRRVLLYAGAFFDDKKVYVTRDADVFYKIRAAKTHDDYLRILDVIILRESAERG